MDVNLILVQNYDDVIMKYFNGEVDRIFAVYSDAIIQQSKGIDTKIVYNPDSCYNADAIVGKGNNLTDVKEKRSV